MQEERLRLWEETSIPLLKKISDALTHWLSDWFHDDIVIDFDRDAISDLAPVNVKIYEVKFYIQHADNILIYPFQTNIKNAARQIEKKFSRKFFLKKMK